MKKIIFISLIVTFFAQISLFSVIGFWRENWQFLITTLLIVVFSQRNLGEGIFWMFLGGFLLDSFSSLPFGFYWFILLTLFFLIKTIEKIAPIKEKNKRYFIVLAFFLTVIFFGTKLIFIKIINLFDQFVLGSQEEKLNFSFGFGQFFFFFVLINWWNFFLLKIENFLGFNQSEIKIENNL